MTNSINTFPYFRPNQILLHSDLNGLVDYINSQNDTFRVLMVGMGILSGYQVSIGEDANGQDCIIVSAGTGISSDGHFFQLEECNLKKYQVKTINKNAFRCNVDALTRCTEEGSDDEAPLTIYELFEKDGSGEAINLDENDVNNDFIEFYNNSVLVLLRCVSFEDRKLCINECDEQGADANVTIRKVLVNKEELLAIEAENTTQPEPPTSNDPDPAPAPPFVPRFGFKPDEGKINLEEVNSFNDLRNCYFLKIFDENGNIITNEFEEIRDSFISAFSSFVGGDQIGSRLDALCEIVYDDNCYIQYFHDYLKDLLLAYLEYEKYKCLAELVEVETEPDFCKHPGYIKLGTPPNFDACRDVAIFSNFQQIDKSAQLQADFYKIRLECMILNGAVNLTTLPQTINVTPSRGKNYLLSERAIPFYYQSVNDTEDQNGDPISGLRSKWRYDWRVKELYFRIPSYTDGGAPRPFTNHLYYDLDAYDFFRIEGHIGRELPQVLEDIGNLRRCNNLPFDIQCVKLAADAPTLQELENCGKAPDCADLERHYEEARWDLICALAEVQGNDLIPFFEETVQNLKDFCNPVNYNNFNNNILPPLQELLNPDCYTPIFESLKDDLESRLASFLFTNFIRKHPGLEHQAGVPKGGTFILAYEEVGEECIVKADFALPYYCCDESSGGALKPEPLIMIGKKKFCANDNSEYEVVVYPTGGTLTVSPNGPHLTVDNCFNPSLVPDELFDDVTLEAEIDFRYRCGGQTVEKRVTVCKVVANFVVEPTDGNDEEKILQITNETQPSNHDDMEFIWTVLEGYVVDENDLTISIPVEDEVTEITVRLEVYYRGCRDVVEKTIEVCDVVADFTYEKEDYFDDNGLYGGTDFIFMGTVNNGSNPTFVWEITNVPPIVITSLTPDDSKIKVFVPVDQGIDEFFVKLFATVNNCTGTKEDKLPFSNCPEELTLTSGGNTIRTETVSEPGFVQLPLEINLLGGTFNLISSDPVVNLEDIIKNGLDCSNNGLDSPCFIFEVTDTDILPAEFEIQYVHDACDLTANLIIRIKFSPFGPEEEPIIEEKEEEQTQSPPEETINLLNQRRGNRNTQLDTLSADNSLTKLSAFKQVKQFLHFPATDEKLNPNFTKALRALATNFGKSTGDRRAQYEQLIEILMGDYLDKQIFSNPKSLSEECQNILKDCATRLKKAKFSVPGLRKILVISQFGDFVSKDLIKQVNKNLK